jgi:hypothetical protein
LSCGLIGHEEALSTITVQFKFGAQTPVDGEATFWVNGNRYEANATTAAPLTGTDGITGTANFSITDPYGTNLSTTGTWGIVNNPGWLAINDGGTLT